MPSRAVLLMTLLLLASAPSQAAQPPASPAPVVEFDHDGQAVEGFVLYATRRQDGVQRRLDLGMPSKGKSGRFQAALPALAPGTWQLELAAYNSAGESPRTKAEPSEVRIDSPVRKPPPAATPPTAKTAAPGAREPSPQKPPPQKPSPQKKKKGAMGKLWGLIVGEDDPK